MKKVPKTRQEAFAAYVANHPAIARYVYTSDVVSHSFRAGWLAAKRAERARRAETRARVKRAHAAIEKARKKRGSRSGYARGKTMIECQECGKRGTLRGSFTPPGGDGTLRFPRKHSVNGQPCPGVDREGIWVEEGRV